MNSQDMPEDKKKKKGILTRFLDWIAKGTRQADKRGQGAGNC